MPPSPVFSTPRVLIVDDNPAIVRVIQALLSRAGFHTETAADGHAALTWIFTASSPFDLVILDLTMPVMSVRAVVMEIENRHPGLPVILCSGSISELGIVEAESAGSVVGVITKPFCLTEFLTTIRAALGALIHAPSAPLAGQLR